MYLYTKAYILLRLWLFTRAANLDPNYVGKVDADDPDPRLSEKPDPDPNSHESQNSGAL
jgi:hypothetical protein